jgi:hypothetical protein
MRTQLAGSGATLREILATGHGELLVTAGAGTLPMGAARGLEELAGNLLLVLLPGQRGGGATPSSSVRPRASASPAASPPRVTASPCALKKLDILGGGAANLQTSEILFGYRAVRRELFSLNLLSLTSGFAKVSGTIGHPTVSLDPGGLLIACAAWASAGLSLLAGDLWRKLELSSDPCARIAAGVRSRWASHWRQ